MDMALSEEQTMFRDMFRDFAQNEVAPCAAALDRDEQSPTHLLKMAAKLDLLGIVLPQRFGGVEGGVLTYALLLEELAKACPSTAVALNAHCATAVLVLSSGREEQQESILPALAAGDAIAASAIREPEGNPQAISTTAHHVGQGWILRGRKCDVILGDVADVLVVTAHVGDHPAAFVIRKDTAGLLVGWRNKQLGLRGAAGSTVFLDDCVLAEGSLLGAGQGGIGPALATSQRFAALGLAFACLGLAERAVADSLSFAQTRQQFGSPIAAKHAIQIYLADMITQVETLRQLAYHTADTVDKGIATEKDIAMLKLRANQVGMEVVNKAVQIHGGIGYIKDYHIERLYRDMRVMTVLGGASDRQRLTVAAQTLVAQET